MTKQDDDFGAIQLIEDESPGQPHSGILLDERSVSELSARLGAAERFLQILVKNTSFQEFMREILFVFADTVKCEAGSILEVDPEKNTLFFRSSTGRSSDTITHFVIPIGKGIAGYVAESKLPLIVNETAENRQHLLEIAKAVGFETRNLVALPILIRGKVYGVLELINRFGEEGFTSQDLELLNYLTDLSAKAIEIRLMLGWAVKVSQGSSAA